jgi:hypothetical protein
MILNNSNWNFKAHHITSAGSKTPMNNGLYARINLKNIKFVSVNVLLSFLEGAGRFLTTLGEDVVTS